MAGSVNKVILIGNLGADPEVRYTANGTAVANFNIATSEQWNDKQGERQERTEWHRIVVWSKLAELCAEYLGKGRKVYVEGRMQTRQWEDREGNKRYTTEVVAQNVTFLDSKSGGHEHTPQGDPQSQGGPQQSQGNPQSQGGGYTPPPMTDDDVPF